MNWGNLLERAAWTAFQAFTATAVWEAFTAGEPSARDALVIGVIAAVFSGLKTIAQERLQHLEAEAAEEGADD